MGGTDWTGKWSCLAVERAQAGPGERDDRRMEPFLGSGTYVMWSPTTANTGLRSTRRDAILPTAAANQVRAAGSGSSGSRRFPHLRQRR